MLSELTVRRASSSPAPTSQKRSFSLPNREPHLSRPTSFRAHSFAPLSARDCFSRLLAARRRRPFHLRSSRVSIEPWRPGSLFCRGDGRRRSSEALAGCSSLARRNYLGSRVRRLVPSWGVHCTTMRARLARTCRDLVGRNNARCGGQRPASGAYCTAEGASKSRARVPVQFNPRVFPEAFEAIDALWTRLRNEAGGDSSYANDMHWGFTFLAW